MYTYTDHDGVTQTMSEAEATSVTPGQNILEYALGTKRNHFSNVWTPLELSVVLAHDTMTAMTLTGRTYQGVIYARRMLREAGHRFTSPKWQPFEDKMLLNGLIVSGRSKPAHKARLRYLLSRIPL